MKRFVTVILGVALCFWSLTPAYGAIDEEDVSRLAKKLQTEKGFAEAWSIPSKDRQILFLKIGFGLNYLIEFKTKSCFRLFDDGVFVIDCGIIKKGYPLVAPLITW